MPIYQYQCEQGHEFEIQQSIHADSLTECECGAKCERIITGGYMTLFESKTLGGIADKNLSKMGTYQKDKVFKAQRDEVQAQKDSAPWWRPGTTGPDKSLNKKTPEQIRRYIEEGK